MSKEKQIEEMVKAVSACECDCLNCKTCYSWELCETLYNAGYRKQSEIIDGFSKELKEYLDDTYSTCEDALIEIHNLIDYIAQKMKGGAER